MLVKAPVGVGILRWKVNQTAEEGKCVAACRFGVSNIPRVQAADPTGPNEGSFRVDRGGSWRDEAADCRSAMGWKNSNLRTEMTRLLRHAPSCMVATELLKELARNAKNPKQPRQWRVESRAVLRTGQEPNFWVFSLYF